jgi:hypothetical protein
VSPAFNLDTGHSSDAVALFANVRSESEIHASPPFIDNFSTRGLQEKVRRDNDAHGIRRRRAGTAFYGDHRLWRQEGNVRPSGGNLTGWTFQRVSTHASWRVPGFNGSSSLCCRASKAGDCQDARPRDRRFVHAILRVNQRRKGRRIRLVGSFVKSIAPTRLTQWLRGHNRLITATTPWSSQPTFRSEAHYAED